jgi:predicted transcriptional regulator
MLFRGRGEMVFGLGKQRSKFGEFIDRHSITVVEFAKVSGVNRKTLGKACNDKDYIPRQDVMKKILKAARKIDPNVKMSDFWDM